MNVMQPWVEDLTFMQQSVLIAAVRAPDGLRKDHPVKVLMRWYRRCILLSAFDARALTSPYETGGGSFTGPFTPEHADAMGIPPSDFLGERFDQTRDVYLRHVDEMPHHFHLHFMHAAQIVGYKHPGYSIREWWHHFYRMIVNDAHLFPESEADMDARLSDGEAAWRAREVVTAA